MRRRLALTTAAVAVMIVAAFLVPLALLVRNIAEDRALAAADRGAATLAPVIAAVDDETAVTQVVNATNASDIGVVTVFLSDGTILGTPGVVDANVDLARTGRSFSTPVAGGVQVLVPVVGADGQTDVVRVFVEDSRLRDGVVPAWIVLGGLGVALVLVAVIVADRLGRSIVNPMNDLARTAERLGHGELTARVEPSGPPEVAEVGQTLNELAGRIGELLDAERESIANLSHRLRTPMTGLRLDIDGLRDLDERSRMTDDVEALTAAIDRVIRDARNRVDDPQRAHADLALDRTRTGGLLGRARRRPRPDRITPTSQIGRVWSRSRPTTWKRRSTRCSTTSSPTQATATRSWSSSRHAAKAAGCSSSRTRVRASKDSDAAATRGVSAGGSTGLGLDIARQTAEASGGRLEVTRASSGGTRVTMELGQPGPL